MSAPRSVRDPEPPGKRPPNWAPGVACPRASCGCGSSSKNWGGDLGTTRVAGLGTDGQGHEKGEPGAPDPPWARTPFGTPQRQPHKSTGAIPLPQLPSPHQERTGPRPTPPDTVGRAESAQLLFYVGGGHEPPAWDAWPAAKVATPSADLTASPGAPGAGQGSSPKPAEGRLACCGLRLPSEGPRTHSAEMAKFKLASPERPATGTERRTS